MTNRLKKHWPLLLLGITLLAIIILSAGLTRSTIGPSEPFPVWIFNNLEPGKVQEQFGPGEYRPSTSSAELRRAIFMIITLGIFIAWFITFIIRPQARNRMMTRLLGYILILLVASWLFDEIRPQSPEGGGGDDVEIGLDGSFLQETPPLPPAVTEPPQWLVIIVTLTITAAVLSIAWMWWQRRQQNTRLDPAELLAREARQAAKTIEAGSDLKDTVLRCYRDMSRVLASSQNIRRQQAMTPREFEGQLAGIGLNDDHIRRLTRLFESVRYGGNTATEREKREAVDCLNAIARTYGGSSTRKELATGEGVA
jgi:hypothetical protein